MVVNSRNGRALSFPPFGVMPRVSKPNDLNIGPGMASNTREVERVSCRGLNVFGKDMVMGKRFYLVLAALLTPAVVSADSIRIGERHFDDVYIREGKADYYIYHPDAGRMERVSKGPSVSEVVISADPAHREALLARYNAHPGVARAESPSTTSAPRLPAATPSVPLASTGKRSTPGPTAILSGDLLKHRRQMKGLAEFEAQLAHWKTLPDELRENIQAGLYETQAERTARRAADHESALAKLNQLDGTRSAVQQQLASAAQARAYAVDQARAEDSSEFYLNAYESSKGYYRTYAYYHDECEGLRTVPIWWYTEDSSLYDAAVAERSRTKSRIGAVEQAYAQQANVYGNQLNYVERAMTRQQRAAKAAVAKSQDEQRRLGDQQVRAAALEEATETDYVPRMRALTIDAWRGLASTQLPEFTVGPGIWKLDCRLVGSGSEAGFALTLYNAETGKPFTRIADSDFLGMRTRVFDEPGRYYVVVEQGLEPVAYEIEVSALELR